MAKIDEVTIYGSNKWSDLKPLELDDKDLIMVDWDKYYKDVFEKHQIVLHHTVSGPGIRGDLGTWAKYKSSIATCVIIERDGTINQLFSSKYWGYHLGTGNSNLDKHSIAIELDSWGQLEKRGDKFYTVYGNSVDVPIREYETLWRDEKYFEAYSYEQLRSLGELLLFWKDKYNIPLTYNEDMWDVSQRALDGEKGVWAHVSYRPYPSKSNKWDVHPDSDLISMLKTIN
ncbi:MAG: N-acetylmuramoyl-L-alanine amidase [Nanoarchaeota archaeon]